MTRYHVHGIAHDRVTRQALAEVTVTVEAEEDGDAQTKAWELFAEDTKLDVTEIEIAPDPFVCTGCEHHVDECSCDDDGPFDPTRSRGLFESVEPQ